jgi:hypothetical protein
MAGSSPSRNVLYVGLKVHSLGTDPRPYHPRGTRVARGDGHVEGEAPLSGDRVAVLEHALRQVAVSTAEVARFCDHSEHNEELDRAWVLRAGERFRDLAMALASAFDLDLRDSYANRLGAIEANHLLSAADRFDGQAEASAAWTWRDLQCVQIGHDRYFHPDVFGLARTEQLRHYVFHLAKLTGFLASATLDQSCWPALQERAIPDMLIFGLKLPTAVGVRLPNDKIAVPDADARR